MNFKKIFVILLTIIFTCYFIPYTFIFYPFGNGIDPSWQIALHLALKNHLVFGRDFVFTYGPMGAFFTRFPIGVPAYQFILFDLFIAANAAYIFYSIYSRSLLSVSIRVAIVALLVLHGDISLLLLWMLVYLLFDFLETRRIAVLIDAIVMCSLAFFVKFSTGLVPLIFVSLFLAFCLWKRILSWQKTGAVAALYVILLVLISIAFPTNLLEYIRSGLSIISGYSEGMYLERTAPGQMTDLAMGVACMILLALPFFLFIKKFIQDKRSLLLYFMVGVTALVLFKVAFTRLHDSQFFSFIIPVAALLAMFTSIEQKKVFYISLLPIMLLVMIRTFSEENLRDRVASMIRPYLWPAHYIASMDAYDGVRYLGEPDTYYIPASYLEKISDKTVDIMPWDIALLGYNKLNYHPRPIPQTYSAYTGYLDQLNADFIEKKGPEYILINPVSIENRNLLYDESKTKIEMLKYYRSVSADWHHILLERLKAPVDFEVKSGLEKTHHLMDTIRVKPTDEIQMAYPEIRYSLAGKLYKFFFWAPDLSINLTLNDNSTHTFKTPLPIVTSGIILNKYIPKDDQAELQLFFDHLGRLNKQVRSISFSTKSPWAFKNTFKMRIETIRFGPDKNAVNTRYIPRVIDRGEKLLESADVKANLEGMMVEKNRVDLQGWGFINDSLMNRMRPNILLEGEKHFLIFPTHSRLHRADVKVVIGGNATDSTGFYCTILKSLLDTTAYKVGLAFIDKDGKIVSKRMFPGAEINNSNTVVESSGRLFALRPFTKGTRDVKGPIKQSLEVVDEKENYLFVSGWASRSDKNNSLLDSVKIILQGSDSALYIADTNPAIRDDVAGHFKNRNMANTGFTTNVNTTSLKSGHYGMFVYVKNASTGDGVYSFIRNVRVGYPSSFTPKPFAEEVTIKDMEMGVDKFSDSPEVLKFSGWAAEKNHPSKGCKILVLLKDEDGKIFAAGSNPFLRPDVSAFLQQPGAFDDSGFESVINKADLPDGIYTVGILVIYDTGEKVASFTDRTIEKEF